MGGGRRLALYVLQSVWCIKGAGVGGGGWAQGRGGLCRRGEGSCCAIRPLLHPLSSLPDLILFTSCCLLCPPHLNPPAPAHLLSSAPSIPALPCQHPRQELTWKLREAFPGRILTAEVTPENPMSVQQLGFDSVWVHSGYFDIIQQHRGEPWPFVHSQGGEQGGSGQG